MTNALLEQVFAACKPNIDALAKAGREKHPSAPLAIMLERQHGGRVVGQCAVRDAAVANIKSSRFMPDDLRRTILADVSSASASQIPVVLVVHNGGDPEIGVWRLSPPAPKPPGFRADEEQVLAQFLAAEVKPLPGETVDVCVARATAWAQAHPNHPHSESLLERANQEGAFYTLGWTMAWGVSTCPRVIVPHKLGKSLMATNCGDDPTAATCAPWSAYTIEIPPELVRFEVDGQLVSFDIIAVWRNLDGASYINVRSRTSSAAFAGKLAFPVPDLPDSEGGWDTDGSVMKRATECLQRLVIGVELKMSDPANVKRPRIPDGKKKAGSGAGPTNNIHRLVCEVTVDCRDAIAEYIAGTRKKTLAVSWLTRGHWTHQPYGPRSSLRRWQQLEPHWNNRGAPVAVRPHRLRETE